MTPARARGDLGQTRRITTLALVISIAVVVVVPGAHFVVSLGYERGALQTKVESTAVAVSSLVSAYPEKWHLQPPHRLEALLATVGQTSSRYTYRVMTADGRVVSPPTMPLAWPTIVRRAELFDAGGRAGSVEVGRSVRPLLAVTAGFGALGLLLGAVVFAVLRLLPLRALARSEERFHAIARSAMDGIVLTDGANRITYWNDSARAIFGAEGGSVPAPSFLSLLAPGGAAEYQQALARCGAPGAGAEPARLLQIVGRRNDGSEVPIELSISPWQQGAEIAYLHVVRDVTERMEADRAVRDLVEHYRLLFDRNPLPMWVVEPETLRFLSVNDAAVRHYGYTRTEFLGMTLRDIRPPEDVAAFDAAMRERQPIGARPTDVWRHRKKDGTVIHVEVTRDSAVLNGRPVRLIAINDVTERRRAEEELDRQRDAAMLREKLSAMGGLIAGVAHELNNPLSVVIGNALLLQAEVKAGPLAGRGDRIANAAKRCARIVKNFLALARHQPRQVQTVDLNGALQEAVDIVEYALRVDGVAVEFDLDSAMPTVWGDAHELGQVVVNLVLNAQQAMHEAPPPRRLTLGSRYDRERGRVQLRVSDTGPGISLEIQQRIFEPLFTTKPPDQGTGLGLSICVAIVERHGGSMEVESAPGRGTTFTVEVPTGDPPASAASPTSGDVAPIAAAAILVVDDEVDVGALVRDILSPDGHRVDVAANGLKALEYLQQRAYDVIISDIRMPELDGPGLYRAVQRWRPALCPRFVFMTGDSLGAETTAFLDTIRAKTLTKPFRPQEVYEAVGRVLAAARAPMSRPEADAPREPGEPVQSA